ncbi:DNA polymerase III subunit delta [Pseudohongiella acticola]|uniref:DNA polymerase III subunit delta n=1 Tax=Pseudohongiella acticola TaxID=1524254 RepID=A0A1E8CF68_9GAMM|nr:DNA polymerase III subunit delta [Pseudohongiella acticola]OFE11049.1 DNA polymerase III subunit delta [Pseudohongiella acticola]
MKIYLDQLEAQLTKNLPAMIWLSGDEPLQMREASDLVRQRCRQQGFNERELHDVDNTFDWRELVNANNSMSLFSDKKLIELRLKNSKMDDASRKILQSCLDDPSPDNILLMTSPKIEAASTKTQWFRKLEAASLVVQIYPVDTSRLPRWIHQRMQHHSLQADAAAVQLLSDRIEGNLLAADQEIEKLSLQFGKNAQITAEHIARSVADNARYNIFGLVDACLDGNAQRAVKTLRRMRDEGSEALMITAMLGKELRQLTEMGSRLQRGEAQAAVYQSHQVWKNKQAMTDRALRRLKPATTLQLLQHVRTVDLAVKGMHPVPPWVVLEQLVTRFARA